MRHKKFNQVLDISKVKPSPTNPLKRTANVTKLAGNLAKKGQRKAVNVVDNGDGTYTLADGHRRYTALLANGATAIVADVSTPTGDETVEDVVNELYRDLNGFTRPWTNSDDAQRAIKAGSAEVAATSGTKAAVAKVLELFSRQEQLFLAANGFTPHILSVAKRVTAYCLQGSGISADTATFQQRVRRTLFWLIEMKSQQWAIVYMRLYNTDAARAKLKKAVDAGQHVPKTTPASAIDRYEASKKKAG